MKKSFLFYLLISLIPFVFFSQSIDSIDYISPFSDSLAAIEKQQKWAFINTEGKIVINFRDDLVKSNFKDGNYPVFKNNRCLIFKEIEGIKYYGFIDETGKTIIKPQFLNATNFNKNKAIALNVIKDTIGNNSVLKKAIVRYGYTEVIINPNGSIIHYLTLKPKSFTLSQKAIKELPQIKTKYISDNLIAIWTEDNTWKIKKLIDLQ